MKYKQKCKYLSKRPLTDFLFNWISTQYMHMATYLTYSMYMNVKNEYLYIYYNT